MCEASVKMSKPNVLKDLRSELNEFLNFSASTNGDVAACRVKKEPLLGTEDRTGHENNISISAACYKIVQWLNVSTLTDEEIFASSAYQDLSDVLGKTHQPEQPPPTPITLNSHKYRLKYNGNKPSSNTGSTSSRKIGRKIYRRRPTPMGTFKSKSEQKNDACSGIGTSSSRPHVNTACTNDVSSHAADQHLDINEFLQFSVPNKDDPAPLVDQELSKKTEDSAQPNIVATSTTGSEIDEWWNSTPMPDEELSASIDYVELLATLNAIETNSSTLTEETAKIVYADPCLVALEHNYCVVENPE